MNSIERRRRFGLAALVAIAALVAGGLVTRTIVAQEKPAPAAAPVQTKEPKEPNDAKDARKSNDAKEGDVGGELVAALEGSPGCLGVETGQMSSGKLTIFAWFEDKKAVLDWYYGDAHQSAMGAMAAGIEASQRARAKSAPNGSAPAGAPTGAPAGAPTSAAAEMSKHAPLEFVPDGTGPILCVATITPSDKPLIPGFPMAIRQISIELYQPLPGGVSVGGTFAPASMPIDHHQRVGPLGPAGPAAPSSPADPAAPKKG